MVEIELSKQGVKYKGMVAVIDEIDLEKVKRHRWSADNHGHTFYAKSSINGRLIYLHNFLTGSKLTDHKDRNGLNNTRENLREATKQQNLMNKAKQSGIYTSIYKGVTFRKNRGTWEAKIELNGKRIYIGNFKSEVDAAKAYNDKAKELHGDFAEINKI